MESISKDQTDKILDTLPQDFAKLKELVGNDPNFKDLENEFNKAYVFQKITKYALDKKLYR